MFMSKNRLEAFSDGVIAIIITLLVLNLKVPKTSSIMEIWDLRISLISYISSFIFVAVIWQNHHQILKIAKNIDYTVVWANTFWLFWLTLAPIVTQWFSSFYHDFWPAFTYAFVFFMWSISYSILVKRLIKANGKDSEISRILSRDNRSRWYLVVNLLVFVLLFFYPPIVLIGRIIVAFLWIKPYSKKIY